MIKEVFFLFHIQMIYASLPDDNDRIKANRKFSLSRSSTPLIFHTSKLVQTYTTNKKLTNDVSVFEVGPFLLGMHNINYRLLSNQPIFVLIVFSFHACRCFTFLLLSNETVSLIENFFIIIISHRSL